MGQTNEKCIRCGSDVDLNEAIPFHEKYWHPTCLCCSICSSELSRTSARILNNKLYCEMHLPQLTALSSVKSKAAQVIPTSEGIISKSTPVNATIASAVVSSISVEKSVIAKLTNVNDASSTNITVDPTLTIASALVDHDVVHSEPVETSPTAVTKSDISQETISLDQVHIIETDEQSVTNEAPTTSTTFTSAISIEKTTTATPSSIHPIAKKKPKRAKKARPNIIPVSNAYLGDGAKTYRRSSSTASDQKNSESILVPMASLRIFRLFYTFEDISSEAKFEKMGFDEAQFTEMLSALRPSLNDKLSVFTVGFVGPFEMLRQACRHYLSLSSDEEAHLVSTIKFEACELNKESLIAIIKNQKIAFVYFEADAAPFQRAPLSSSLLAIDYIRYLTDLCEDIIIMLPDTINVDLKLESPFQDAPNTGMIIKEVHIEQSKNIEVTQLRMAPLPNVASRMKDHSCSNLCRAKTLMFTDDHSRHLFAYHMTCEQNDTLNKVAINVETLKGLSPYSSSVGGKPMTYHEVKAQVQKEWHNKKFFDKLPELAELIFRGFLRDDYCTEFTTEIERIFKDAVGRITSTHNQEALNTLDKFIKDKMRPTSVKFTCSHVESKAYSRVNPRKYISKDPKKRSDGCSPKLCQTVGTLLKKWSTTEDKLILNQLQMTAIDEEVFDFVIHHEQIESYHTKFLEEEWKNHMTDACNACRMTSDSIRKSAIDTMLHWLESRVVIKQETYSLHLEISIFAGTPVADKTGTVNDFKITDTGRNILLRLDCKEKGNNQPYISQFFFVTNTIGYINISNWPPGHSRIYVFNLTMMTAPPELIVDIRSADARILVDPKAKTYFIYNNETQRIERGRLDEISYIPQSTVTSEDLYHIDIEDLPRKSVLERINSICSMSDSEAMLLLDGNQNLVEYKPLVKDGRLRAVFKRKNETTHIAKIPIQASNGTLYLRVDSLPDGQCILLQSSNSLDIYDLTWLKIGQIAMKSPTATFKILASEANTFIQVYDVDGFRTYRLSGLTATSRFDVTVNDVKRATGFPYLDIFYLIQRKFGPQTSCIGAPRKTNIHLFLSSDHINRLDDIDAYFGTLKVTRTEVKIESTAEIELVAKLRQKPISFDIVRQIVQTRVPLHVATIEQCNLFPLSDGRNITNDIAAWRCADESAIVGGFIQNLIALIHFGSYEAVLNNLMQTVKVISIVGRQSGGKSYLLNRMSGTRFNVASTRCTDGIWLSMAYINNQPFVVLDCEGLFSTRRNEMEETKLCLCLAAMTDVFFLNQDLAFSRHLTTLFNNFAKACDRVKGANLFKGFLGVIIRDVSSQDRDGAYRELASNIEQQAALNTSGYMRKLFGGEIRSFALHHFENNVFESEIEVLRNMLLELPGRWPDGKAFLESFKLILAQVHTDDDTLMDIHRLRLAFARLEREVKKAHIEGGELFKTCEPCNVTIKILSNPNKEETVTFDQQSLDFSTYINESSLSSAAFLFRDAINEHASEEYEPRNHNTFFNNVNAALIATLSHRVQFLMNYVHSQLPVSDPTFSAEINNFKLSLKDKLDELQQNARLCLRRCRECARLCSKEHDHRDDCACGTDHSCPEKCSLCPSDQPSIPCCLKFGHEEKHRCNTGHVCGKPCTISIDCTSTCSLSIAHDEDESLVHEHDCGNAHYCQFKCESCELRNCSFDVKKKHKQHDCGEKLCLQPCSMPDCAKLCKFPDHFHDHRIIEKNTTVLRHGTLVLDYHICDEDHECKSDCTQNGVCFVDLEPGEMRLWENRQNRFEYIFYRPKKERKPCVKRLPAYYRDHLADVKHDCGLKEKHRCGAQCPDCLSFCRKEIDHQGRHDTPTHRNKEGNVWASQVSSDCSDTTVIVQDKGAQARRYDAGESCRPETCSIACKRRGRAHAHLKECPGLNTCPAKMYPDVRHSNDKWQPYPTKKFDLWLCRSYWHSLNWEQPLDVNAEREALQLISKCSFVCAHPSGHPGEVEERFCKKDAWHTDEHEFTCTHPKVSSLDIVFVCDTTGSMGGYINEIKTNTCQRIMNTAITAIKDVQFRFVAYRDHPPQDSTYVIKTSNDAGGFCNASELQNFVAQLDANGGGDGPEAVLDGLWNAGVKSKWRDANTLKYVVHIADAPPHGRLYTNGHGDGFPDGCPCELTIEQIAAVLSTKQIRYKLMKIGSAVNTMATIFRKHITEYEESDLSGTLDLTNKFVGILARDLQVKEMDVHKTK